MKANKNTKSAKDQLNTCKGFIMLAVTSDNHIAYINDNEHIDLEEAACIREICRRLSLDSDTPSETSIPTAEIVE